MVILSAFVLAVTSEAATSFLQQNKDVMFSQVPTDTWQSPTKEHPINGFSGRKARA